MTLSPSTPPAWPTSPLVQRQPRTKRDGSAGRSPTATNVGACRASTQASSPSKHYCPTQMEKNSARCRNPTNRQDRAHAVPSKSSNPSSIFLWDLQAAILQQTAEYIFTLEQEKTQLLAQNNQLKRFIQVCGAFFY